MVVARAVIIATGVTYRRVGVPGLESFVGTGVFLAPPVVKPRRWPGQEVFVIGGANSAGQAALHLARFAARVTLLIRGQSLAAGMSDYLVKQLEATPNIDVLLSTRLLDGRGRSHFEALTLEDLHTGRQQEVRNGRIRAHRRGTPHRVAPWRSTSVGSSLPAATSH